MYRTIINIIILHVLLIRLSAQDTFSVSILNAERKIFDAKDEAERNQCLLNKIRLYVDQENINLDLLRDIKRVNTSILEVGTPKQNFLWNAAIASFMNEDYNNAKNYLSGYLKEKTDTTAEELLLSAIIYHQHDPEKINQILLAARGKDSLFESLYCLNTIELQSHLKAHKLLIISSYFIPGSGSIVMGKPLKGIVSLALVGAFGFSTYALASSGLYLNALFVTFPWLHKFYFGQIRLTKKLLDEKQQRRTQKKATVCQKNVEILLKKYPISLR